MTGCSHLLCTARGELEPGDACRTQPAWPSGIKYNRFAMLFLPLFVRAIRTPGTWRGNNRFQNRRATLVGGMAPRLQGQLAKQLWRARYNSYQRRSLAYVSSAVPPVTQLTTSAIRMIASIQNAGISARVNTFCKIPSSSTPVSAPSRRPLPPLRLMPPITAAAKT